MYDLTKMADLQVHSTWWWTIYLVSAIFLKYKYKIMVKVVQI